MRVPVEPRSHRLALAPVEPRSHRLAPEPLELRLRHLALVLLTAAACSSAGEKNTPAAGVASADAVPATSVPASISSDTSPPAVPRPASHEDAAAEQLRMAAVAKYQVRAAEREKLPTAFGSAIIQLAIVRKNGGQVDDKVVQDLWKRLKAGVCFSEPKLNIVDRTKKKKPVAIIEPLRSAAAAKLETTRASCPNGKQPLALSIRIDSFDQLETAGEEKTTRLKPGVSLPAGSKPDPSQTFDYDMDTLERTVSASGEVAIDSRVFPFKVSERSRDRGNAEMTLPSGLHVSADELQVRSIGELDDEIIQRILVIVQQALDRHLEGLRKAYTNMAIQTAAQDDGASQEHHALEVVALGGRLDDNPTLSQKLAERYEMPASDLVAALTALHLD